MSDREETITKISIAFAMEHGLPPKVVFQFATLLANADRNSMNGLAILFSKEWTDFIKAVDGDRPMGPYPQTSERCDDLIAGITKRLKKAL